MASAAPSTGNSAELAPALAVPPVSTSNAATTGLGSAATSPAVPISVVSDPIANAAVAKFTGEAGVEADEADEVDEVGREEKTGGAEVGAKEGKGKGKKGKKGKN